MERSHEADHVLDGRINEYKSKYEASFMACMNPDSHSGRILFMDPEFSLGAACEFVRLYETRYPERGRAFDRFFQRVDPQLSEHMMKIRCMTYMLEEKTVVRMLGAMEKTRGIYMEMSLAPNPKKGGASAYFGRDMFYRPRIRYYEIEAKGRLAPPYKTFFHEFGHGFDDIQKWGRGFYSDRFSFTQKAEKKQLRYDKEKGRLVMDCPCAVYKKTIHQWMAFDVENHIIHTAYQLVSEGRKGRSRQRYLSPGISPELWLRIIEFVTYQRFLKPEGIKPEEMMPQPGTSSEVKGKGGEESGWDCHKYELEIQDLYEDIQEITNQIVLKNVFGMIVLPKDLFGGITNNQLGGGHSGAYWFGRFGRKREVSREAFAGYFEYRSTVMDAGIQEQVINPHHCIPCTAKALEGMLERMFETD